MESVSAVLDVISLLPISFCSCLCFGFQIICEKPPKAKTSSVIHFVIICDPTHLSARPAEFKRRKKLATGKAGYMAHLKAASQSLQTNYF